MIRLNSIMFFLCWFSTKHSGCADQTHLDLSCWCPSWCTTFLIHPPTHPPAFSPSRRLTKTGKDGGGGRGDKAGSLSTRPEPSLPIFPPTSIDDVVCGGGGGAGGSGLITFPSPCHRFRAARGEPASLFPLVTGGCICC